MTDGPETPRQAVHAMCHDLVCNGDRSYPRGEKGHSCSCYSRANRESAETPRLRALAERLQRAEHERIWEPMNPADYKGHTRLKFEYCPHPDCALVRAGAKEPDHE